MAYQEISETEARALGSGLPISTRKSVEICNALRGKPLKRALAILEQVIYKEVPIPMRRYNRDTAHKPGMAAGRYPIKASREITKVLENAQANASQKGLDTAKLVIAHIAANQSSRPWHFGRQRRRKMKRTNIEVVVREQK